MERRIWAWSPTRRRSSWRNWKMPEAADREIIREVYNPLRSGSRADISFSQAEESKAF